MKYATIVHGSCDQAEYFSDDFPSLTNSHWLPWLQKQLLMHGWLAQTPEMPGACRPVYEQWRDMFERLPLNRESLLIGHSYGAGFLTRWLSEAGVAVAKLILVAPWIDPTRRRDPEFFDFTIDAGLTERAEVHILSSDDDMEEIVASVDRLCAELPRARRHDFHAHGHFCLGDMGTAAFPELRDIALAPVV